MLALLGFFCIFLFICLFLFVCLFACLPGPNQFDTYACLGSGSRVMAATMCAREEGGRGRQPPPPQRTPPANSWLSSRQAAANHTLEKSQLTVPANGRPDCLPVLAEQAAGLELWAVSCAFSPVCSETVCSHQLFDWGGFTLILWSTCSGPKLIGSVPCSYPLTTYLVKWHLTQRGFMQKRWLVRRKRSKRHLREIKKTF